MVAVIGGLLAFAAPSAGSVEQVGTTQKPNNYYGPGPCPDANTWNCEIHSGDVEIAVVQKAATGGINRFECDGATCGHPDTGGVTQTGIPTAPLLPPNKPTNEGTCGMGPEGNTTTEQTSTQTCNLHQLQGETNTANIKFTAKPSVDRTLSGPDIVQSSTQQNETEQRGNRNKLNVTLTINQTASEILKVAQRILHNQQTLMRSQNTMEADTSNEAKYTLVRKQSSNAQGGVIEQVADTSTDGGLGEIDLVANSVGWNDIDISAEDTKTQTGTSLSLAKVTQTMGRVDDLGGWLAQLDVDSGTPNPNGPDIDVGDAGNPPPEFPPGPRPGIRETWTQNAWGPVQGIELPQGQRAQSQFDGIGPLPLIGNSPFTMISNDRCDLTAQQGARIVAHHAAGKIAAFPASTGHTKEGWTGGISCRLAAGNLVRTPSVYWGDKTDVAANLTCEERPDGSSTCPDATVTPIPLSHAHMAVRNVATEPAFTGDESPSSTSAEPGQVVEQRAVFHNNGEAGSLATNATLTTFVPDGTSFVSCSNGCAVSPDNVVTWNLNDEYPNGVPGGTAVSRTLQLKVNADAVGGSTITNHAIGDDDQEGPFNSNEVSVLVVARPPREIVIDVLEQSINASKPKNGVANVVINDTSVVPSSVCFGDLDEGQCTTGTSLGVGNFDTDPENELKMKFLIKDTGIDPGDTRACLRGLTTSGESVHGCDTINAN